MTNGAHPAKGPHHPTTATPARRAGSVRRTTTHDSLRPDGLTGDVLLMAAGRDLRTNPDGTSAVLDTARLDTRIAFAKGRRIEALATEPDRPELAALVGGGTAGGYRTAVEAALPDERRRGSVLFQLLDDLPNALLVNGYAIAIGLPTEERLALRQASSPHKHQRPDLCAGWRVGGTIITALENTGLPPISRGPAAPDLRVPDDPDAWHSLEPLPPLSMRRIRRIDIWPAAAHSIAVEAFFRDSCADRDGAEEVVHEYTVHATVDPDALRFVSCRTNIGVLPFAECPDAAPSADRLTGLPLAGLRSTIRTDFTGPSTCTHLNDTLRALEDLPTLIAALP